jgi:hypothetical protein
MSTSAEQQAAGQELDRLTTAYRIENPETTYEQAFTIVRLRHPQLARQYARPPAPTPPYGVALRASAGDELVEAAESYQREHHASVEEAIRAVAKSHAPLLATYCGLSTDKERCPRLP